MYFYVQKELKAFLINELAISERSSKIATEKAHIWNASKKISEKYNEEYFIEKFSESVEDMIQTRGFFDTRIAIDDWLNECSPVMSNVVIILGALVEACRKGQNRISYDVLRAIGYG
jgi:hypothetical protein